MKNQKGITLIALIITIIVMLILVGVSINVALNGGLFNNAKEASKKTEIEAEKERLLGFVLQAYDAERGEVVFEKLDTILEAEGWGGTNGTYTSPNGNTIFVNKNGKVDDKKDTETDPDLETLKKFVLGKNLTGRDLTEISQDGFWYSNKFKNDPETINNAETSVEFLLVKDENLIYAKYKGKAYKIITTYDEINYEYITKDVKFVYEPKGKEGQDLGQVLNNPQYNGWIILYDHGNGKYEAISPDAMGNLTLGHGDTTVNWNNNTVIAEANIDGEEGLSETEKSIYSYNHAIETINTHCEGLEGLPTNNGVRSIGAKEELGTTYLKLPGDAVTYDRYNEKIKEGDIEFEQDLTRMRYWNDLILFSDSWIASRKIGRAYLADGKEGRFAKVWNVSNTMKGDSNYNMEILEFYFQTSYSYGYSRTFPVRPVITVET